MDKWLFACPQNVSGEERIMTKAKNIIRRLLTTGLAAALLAVSIPEAVFATISEEPEPVVFVDEEEPAEDAGALVYEEEDDALFMEEAESSPDEETLSEEETWEEPVNIEDTAGNQDDAEDLEEELPAGEDDETDYLTDAPDRDPNATKTIVWPSTKAIRDPKEASSAGNSWTGSYVWYGKYEGEPVRYRVLKLYERPDDAIYGPTHDHDNEAFRFSRDRATMFLDSDRILFDYTSDNDWRVNGWRTSSLRNDLNGEGFLDKDGVFSGLEKDAIIVSNESFRGKSYENYTINASNYGPINEKIFILGKTELEDRTEIVNDQIRKEKYGYHDAITGNATIVKMGPNGNAADWWLRDRGYTTGRPQYVSSDGKIKDVSNTSTYGVSPAFNIAAESVVFESLISTESSPGAGKHGAEYTLTLLDDGLEASVIDTPTYTVDNGKTTVTIPYAVADYSEENDANTLVAIVTPIDWVGNGWNRNRIDDLYKANSNDATYAPPQVEEMVLTENTGDFTFELDDKYLTPYEGTGSYHIYLFAMDKNGAYETDFAGIPAEVCPVREEAVEPVSVRPGINRIDLSRYIAKDKKVVNVEDPEGILAGDPTISGDELNLNVKAGFISGRRANIFLSATDTVGAPYNIRIAAVLSYPGADDGITLYSYVKQGVTTSIDLSGYIEDGGKLTLDEVIAGQNDLTVEVSGNAVNVNAKANAKLDLSVGYTNGKDPLAVHLSVRIADKSVAGLGPEGIIHKPDLPEENSTDTWRDWKGDKVYFGRIPEEAGRNAIVPSAYRVLDTAATGYNPEDPDAKTMLLESDTFLLFSALGPDDVLSWPESKARSFLNGEGFLTGGHFTAIEQDAMVPSTIASHPLTTGSVPSAVIGWNPNYTELDHDKVFLLDPEDYCNENYGYPKSVKSYERLRHQSAPALTQKGYGRYILLRQYGEDKYICMDNQCGGAYPYYFDPTRELVQVEEADCFSVSPAFNLDLSSVVLTLDNNNGAGYTFAIPDKDLQFEFTDPAGIYDVSGGRKVEIPYSISDKSNTSDPDCVMAVVTDGTWTENGWSDGAKLLQCEKLDMTTFKLKGTGWFDLDNSITGDFNIYVFAMDENPVYETSYVSEPVLLGVRSNVTGYDGVYDGQAHGITVDVQNPVYGAVVKYGTSEGKYNLTESPKITNVSESPLMVYYQITAPGSEAITGSATVTIRKADSILETAPAARESLKYNKAPQVLVKAGSAAAGTLYYAKTDKDAEAPEIESYGLELPKAENAGDYAVWYMIKGDENHKDTEPQKIEVSIAKADFYGSLGGSHTVIAGEATNDATFTLPILPEGWTYSQTVSIKNDGSGLIKGTPRIEGTRLIVSTNAKELYTTAELEISLEGDDNHNDKVETVIIMSSPTKDADVVIVGGNRKVTYGDEAFPLEATVTYPGTGTGKLEWNSTKRLVADIDPNTGEVTIKSAGETLISATYTPEGSSSGSTTYINLKVEKKPLDITWSDDRSFVYNGTSQHPTAVLTGVPVGDTVRATVSVTKTGTGTGYVAKAALDGESAGNYVLSEDKETCLFSVSKANLQDAEIVPVNALTYNGSAQTQNVAVKLGENVLDASEYEVTGNTKTDAGTHTLTVTAKAGGNCTGQATKEFTIAKKQTTVTTTIAAQSFTGKAINPKFTVKEAGGETLVYERDYLYEVTDNLNVGTGKVRIYPAETGNYSFPEKEVEFRISESDSLRTWDYYITRYCRSFDDLHDSIDFSEYLPEDCGEIYIHQPYGCKQEGHHDNIFEYQVKPRDPDADSTTCTIYVQMQNYSIGNVDHCICFHISYYKQSMSLCEKGKNDPIGSKKLTPGKSFTLVPKYENVTNANVTWTSSDPDVAKVDQNGKVTAIAAGYTQITATGQNLSAQCSVVVTEAVTSLTLDQKKYTLCKYEEMKLTAAILPFTASETIKWSTSDSSVLGIRDSNGELLPEYHREGKKVTYISDLHEVTITAWKQGSAKITAEAADGSGKKAVCSFTAGNELPYSCSLTTKGNAKDLAAGKTLAMDVNWGDTIPANTNMVWSVVKADDETADGSDIATISPKGVLTGLKEGKIKVVAESVATNSAGLHVKAISEEIMVYVPVKSVALNMNSGTVSLKDGPGKTLQILPVITSAVPGQEATGVNITCSRATEDQMYLSVDDTGLVTAEARPANNIPVSVTVKAYGYEKTLICKVSVKEENPLKSIKVSSRKLTIGEGNKASLIATLDPVNPDVEGYTWSSSDENVATVDSNGKIVGLKPGKATITATATGTVTVRGEEKHPSASCEVTVTPSVTGIELKNLSVTAANRLAVGKTLSAKTAFLSSDGKNKAKTTLAWTSSNPKVATVSPKGVVKAVAPGTARITAVSTDAKAEGGTAPTVSFDVEVFAPVTKVSLDKSKLTLGTQKGSQYGKVSVSAILPSFATDPSIEWTVNNENVSLAAIPQEGLAKTGLFNAPGKAVTTKAGEALAIRALVPGTVKLTGITTDGTKKKVSCTITIRGNVTGLKLQTTTTTNRLGQVELVKSGQYRSRLKAGGKMSLKAIVSINGIAGDETDKTRKKLYSDYKKTTEAGVSYRSSRPDVIKVDKNGKITVDRKAAKGQMATIYAVAADGQSVQIRISVVE